MVSNADIVSVTESVRTLKALHEPVVIFCCAIGPLHPREVSKPLQDLDAIGRELSGIIEIYSSLPAVDTHFVLVSSILAISSGPRRFYYSGWKRAIEATIGELIANRPGGRFSVIYPGRLVAVKSFSNPFATTYADCAHVLRSIGLGPTRKRILGVDARLYLMARSFNTGILALLGRPV